MGIFRKKKKEAPIPDVHLPKILIEMVGTEYKTPDTFLSFKKNFNSEVQQKLKETKSRADTIRIMKGRVDAEGNEAIAFNEGHYSQRLLAVEGFAKQRRELKKSHEGIIENAKAALADVQQKIEKEKSKLEGTVSSKPWWATKKMLALMTVAFTGVDAYLFFLFTQTMNINIYMKYGLAILLGLVITLVPILIAYCVRRLTSVLEKNKGKYKVFSGISVFAWLLVFALTVYMRIVYADILLEDPDVSHALALALFLSAIPLLTGIATFFISFESYNPDVKDYADLKDEEQRLQKEIVLHEEELTKFSDIEKRLADERDTEEALFNSANARINAACKTLKERINTI